MHMDTGEYTEYRYDRLMEEWEYHTANLKPCMKCKSTDVSWFDGPYHSFLIECESCGLRTPEFDTYDEAEEFWNNRVEPDIPGWLIDGINRIRETIRLSKYYDWKYARYSDSEQHNIMKKEIDEVICNILSLKKEDPK